MEKNEIKLLKQKVAREILEGIELLIPTNATGDYSDNSNWFYFVEHLEERIAELKKKYIVNNETKYKHFEIRKPTILGRPPTEDYYKYNFDLVKWADDFSHCWSIGFLRYRTNGDGFEFESVGLRYLKYREEGLEEFILKWCELQESIIETEET